MPVFRFFRRGGTVAASVLVTALIVGCGSGDTVQQGPNSKQLFLRDAVESTDHSQVTLPIYQGTSQGQAVWYVITDSSNQADAQTRGVNFAPKLANVIGTTAVQTVTVNSSGVIDFPATVTFGQAHVLTPGVAAPFPPAKATPGSTGQQGYSPLIMLPSGIVLNASHVANASGRADKAISIDTTARTITYKETLGFFANRRVHYASFDGSASTPATLEDVTFAAALAAGPRVNDESSTSARETIIAFTNGQTGVSNPERQGLGATILDGIVPLNILDDVPLTANGPGSVAYTPLWDVSLATWSPAAITAAINLHQTSVAAVRALAAQGMITSPSGGAFGGSGPIANCPAISLEATP